MATLLISLIEVIARLGSRHNPNAHPTMSLLRTMQSMPFQPRPCPCHSYVALKSILFISCLDTLFGGHLHRHKMCLMLLLSLCTITSPLDITVGFSHNCVLKYSEAKCWGENTNHQLGYGDTNDRGIGANDMGDNLLAIELGSSFIPMQIAPGFRHTCALSTTNKLKCWGRNLYGTLGYGDQNDRGAEMGDNLFEVDLGPNFISMRIMTGWRQTCSLSTANKLKCWGFNSVGQLGYSDTNNRGGSGSMGANLLEIDLGSNFIPMQICLGHMITCALSTTNKIKCWGFNIYGQLGYGDTNHRGDESNEMGDNLLEVPLGSSFSPIQISTGSQHTCALSIDNKVKCG
eukprot:370438_1